MSINVHVIRCDGPPTVAPTLEGQHWIDTVTGDMWFANGTASVANWVLLSPDTDVKVKVSAADTTAGYLNDELIVANGSNTTSPLEKSIVNPGADEKLQLKFDQTKLSISSTQIPSGSFAVPVDVGSANAAGVATTLVRSDHVHKGVRSIKQNAGTQRFGDVSLQNGTGISVTDDGAGNFTITNTIASNVLKHKAGTVALGSFSGDPRKATVTFSTPFADANYAITITGNDNRNWSWESKTAGGFVINSNAKAALTGNTDWQCIYIGESS